MHNNSALLAICFAAGVIGALLNSLAAWAFGQWGVTELAGVQMAPAFTLGWLYPRLVWGGIWGVAYFLFVGGTKSRHGWIRKGLWVSLLATAAQLFYFFPYATLHGQMGLGLGNLTPFFVLLYNFIWGFFTGLFARFLWGK